MSRKFKAVKLKPPDPPSVDVMCRSQRQGSDNRASEMTCTGSTGRRVQKHPSGLGTYRARRIWMGRFKQCPEVTAGGQTGAISAARSAYM